MRERAIDMDQLKEVLQHAANMLYELRTGRLTPKHYYRLYVTVLDQLHTLEQYFIDVNKKGKLNAQDLKQRCSIFYKSMTPKDYKLLVGESGVV